MALKYKDSIEDFKKQLEHDITEDFLLEQLSSMGLINEHDIMGMEEKEGFSFTSNYTGSMKYGYEIYDIVLKRNNKSKDFVYSLFPDISSVSDKSSKKHIDMKSTKFIGIKTQIIKSVNSGGLAPAA